MSKKHKGGELLKGVKKDWERNNNGESCCVLKSVPTTLKTAERVFLGCKIIDTECFKNCEVKSVVFSYNKVKEVRDRAFKDCKKLEEIYFSGSIEIWGEEILSGCGNLKMTVFGGHVNLEELIKKNMFDGCDQDLIIFIGYARNNDGGFTCDECTSLRQYFEKIKSTNEKNALTGETEFAQ